MDSRERCRTRLLALVIVVALFTPSAAGAAPGDLDPSFGAGGKVITDFGGEGQGEILSAAIDSQDRIVAAGYRSGAYALARYLGR
jgi:hypothetical protein